MYQTIGEPIRVVGVYERQTFVPKKFRWHDRTYVIDRVTFVTDIRDGLTRKRTYSVTCGPNAYRLLFDRTQETWVLKELWVE